jgi:methanogenic corrinoid protein MtbC1
MTSRLRRRRGPEPPSSARVDGTTIDLEPLAREICHRYGVEHPDEQACQGEAGPARYVRDTPYLLAWAAADRRLRRGQLVGNVSWLARVWAAERLPIERLARNLQIAADVVAGAEFPEARALAEDLRDAAESVLAHALPAQPPDGSAVRDAYLAAVLHADPRSAHLAAEAALDAGMPVRDLYLGVLQDALYEVGRLWQNGEASVADEHLAAVTTQTLVARVSARLSAPPQPERTGVVASTEGDLHALGARFVADVLEGEGWVVIDLGANTPADDLVSIVAERRPALVGLSTTLAANLPQAQTAIAALDRLDRRPLIAVGGQAYQRDPTIAERLGADLYAPDAATFLHRLDDHRERERA